MPITVRHEPSLQLVDNAALFAGQGEFLDRQQQHAARQRALDQQAFQNERELQSRLYMQAQAQAANQNSQLFQAARQNALMQQQREQQLADLGEQRKWQGGVAQQANTWKNERFDRQQNAIWETNSVGASEKGVSDQLADIAAKRDQLASPQDQKKFDDLNAQWDAVRANRILQSNPKAYGEAIGKFQRELQNPEGVLNGIVSRMKPPPTVKELKEQGGIDEEKIYDDDGNLMGVMRSRVVVRNGERQLDEKFIPYKPPADPRKDFVDKNLDQYDGDIDATLDAYDRVVARDAQVKEALARRDAAAFVGEQGFTLPGLPPTPPQAPLKPTPKTATNIDDYWNAIDDDERRKWNANALKILPKRKDKDGNEIPPSPDDVVKTAKALAAATKGFSSPAKPAEPAKPRDWIDWITGNSPVPGPDFTEPAHAKWEAYRRQNPENAAALEQWATTPQVGEEYTAPDGTRRRRVK